MKTSLEKSFPLILLVILLVSLPFSFGNGKCPNQPNITSICVPPEGGMIGSESPIFTVGEFMAFSADPMPGYLFSHWGGDVSGEANPTMVLLEKDVEIIAYFIKAASLHVVVEPPGGGSVSPMKGDYKPGTTVTITETPAKDYCFDRWSEDASGGSPEIQIEMDKDKNITAHFVKGFSLLTSTDPPGAGSVYPEGGIFPEGSTVKIKGTPFKGYSFERWGGDASGVSDNYDLLLNGNKKVTAHFAKVFDLLIKVSPEGGGTVGVDIAGQLGGLIDGKDVYKEGTEVGLFPHPARGYRFSRLTDEAGNELTSALVKMDADRTVTAHFVRVYTLTTAVSPTGGGSVSVDEPIGHAKEGESDAYTFDEGTEVTLTANPTLDFTFREWSYDASGDAMTIKIIMDGDKYIVANFFYLYVMSTPS
jgi:hypothetical protein